MAYTPASRTAWLVTAQLLSCRGEPFVQGPGALLRERPVQLLTLLGVFQLLVLSHCLWVSRLVARRPRYCTTTVAITVTMPTLAAMIAAVTSGLMSGPTDQQGRGVGPLVHAAVSVEFEQRDHAERRGDRLGVQVADRLGDRLGWPVVVDVGGADVRSELPGPGRGSLNLAGPSAEAMASYRASRSWYSGCGGSAFNSTASGRIVARWNVAAGGSRPRSRSCTAAVTSARSSGLISSANPIPWVVMCSHCGGIRSRFGRLPEGVLVAPDQFP